MPLAPRSFKHNVWQLIFIPAFSIIILLATCLVSYCLYELSKFVDMRGSAMTRKTAQLIYTPLLQNNPVLIQALLDGSLEDPYVRALHIHLTTGETFHTGPDFLPTTDVGIEPNELIPVRRETRRTILFSHPIANKEGLNPIGWIEMEMLSSPYMVIHYQNILITLAITFLCLLVAVYLAICLFQAITTPLTHIKQVINHLAQGKLETRVQPQTNREFIEIADALNEMADSLEVAQQNLQKHIEQSTQDLRETLETIEIKNIELDMARKEALEASRIKSEFLANTSHEIRTPLNGILGFAALILKTKIDEQQTDYINTIHSSAQSLLTVINGILDFSKLESGKLTLEYAPLPLHQTIDETLHTLAPDAHEKNLQLLNYVDAKIPSVLLGDSLRFRQILSNLVSNAIKFSEQGSIIVRVSTIATQETHLLLKVSVTDQGKGLTQIQQKNLFKPFSQTDSSNTREQGGTGLGLAICKGLVERMHGEIGVESQIDQGSTFWFTARFGIDKKFTTLASTPQLSQHRVLLCGTHQDALEHLQFLLREWEIEEKTIRTIHDIFPAIRQAKANNKPFELLILDIAPNEPTIPPVLLNNISEQLSHEFNCKVIACCTTTQQRLFRINDNNTLFIRKPIAYDNLLKLISENLNILLTDYNYKSSRSQEDHNPIASVLLVDDNPANLQLASELLLGLNTQVVQANNGLQAIEACKNNQFDVIFMDIQMPGIDGFETTRRIRDTENGLYRTPIIALTAHSITEQKSQLLLAGMDDCISKPVNEAQLAHIINRWASLRGKREVIIQENIRIAPTTPLAKKEKTQPENSDSSSSVDIPLCLKLANNKPALARDMLRMMLDSLPTEKTSINQAIAENNMQALSELIHRLYGSSCYCGVPRLKSISGLLDKLLEANKMLEATHVIATLNNAIDDVLLWGNCNDLDTAFDLQEKTEAL